MAHEIHEHDSLVYSKDGGVPWHGLGIAVDEAMTPTQAMKLAGLDWEVGMTPLSHTLPSGEIEGIESFKACTRLDTKEVFGVFSKYQPVQNSEVFDLAYTLGDSVKVETAGSLFNGRKLFVNLKGDSFVIGNGDKIERYLVLANSHDGTMSLTALNVSVRVVCQNTLNMALKTGAKKGFSIKHTANASTKIAEMERALKRFKETGVFFEEQMNYLHKKALNKKKLMEFFTDCYDKMIGAPETERQELDAEEAITAWTTTLETERAMFGSDVNAFLALNAITDWTQHKLPGRVQAGWEEKRTFNNLFGTISDSNVLATNLALAI